MKKEFIPVILGSDDNTYGLARVFHEKYNTKSVALATTVLETCKNTKIIDFIVDAKLHDEKYLIDKLVELGNKLKKEYEKVFVVPCSDSYLEMLSKGKDRLTMYENVFVSYDKLAEFNKKESFYKMCEKYHLPYPKSLICTSKDYKQVVSKLGFTYPLILKPNNSNSLEYLNAAIEGKEKVYFINSKEELLSKLETIYNSDYNGLMIIQEFVHGDDTNMRVLNVYCNRQGKVKVMALGQPILEEYHPATFGNYAAIISIPGLIPIMNDIKRFLEDIKYTGAANFDIKMDSKTGKYYLFEINPRLGRSSFFTTPAGASIQEAYVEDLVHDNLQEKFGCDKEILWLNLPLVLVKKYVKNKEILDKVMRLKRAGNVYHTLIYKGDYHLGRRFIVNLQYARKIHYYPKYYIEKK